MSSLVPARRVALSLAGEVRRRDARARDLLRTSPRMRELTERDRSFVVRLVLGVVLTRGALDERIDALLSRGHLDPRVRDALRLASFELLYLSTPPEVAVDQGVELVRSVAPRASGLANALLRKVAAQRAALDSLRDMLALGAGDVQACAAVSGMPMWLARRIAASRGMKTLRSVALSQAEAAPIYVGHVPTRHGLHETEELLSSYGLAPVAQELPGAFLLKNPAHLAASRLVHNVDVVVCDLYAQTICHLVVPTSGQRILEVGQGRATKTILIAALAQIRGVPVHMVSIDVNESKVFLAKRRLARAGLDEITCLCFDGRALSTQATLDTLPSVSAVPTTLSLASSTPTVLPPALDGCFDTVFVDAPCSGTGTMRRHPEIAWSLIPSMLDPTNNDSLPALQRSLLAAASARVDKGGSLVYATCSLLSEENEEVIRDFLASEEGTKFVVESISPDADADGMFRSFPTLGGPDGHFCCRMRRCL